MVNEPLLKMKRERRARQKSALSNLAIGLVLGSSLMFLFMELHKGIVG